LKVKNIIFAILSSVIIFIIISLNEKDKSISIINQMDFLLNSWVEKREDKTIIEKWEKVSPNTIEGKSIYLDNKTKDTIFREELRLVEMLDDIYYITYIETNKDLVSFRLIDYSIDNQYFRFENNKHDFPKYISYLSKSDSLFIEIGNEKKSINFTYTKK